MKKRFANIQQFEKIGGGDSRTGSTVNRLDVELNHVLEVLATEYELSFERAKELYPPKEEINHLEKKVRSLKRMLSQLGDVNIGAIEEYERLSDRLSFFQSQEARFAGSQAEVV